MSEILGNAVSGLLSFQRALTTTSHNIANVNTPGYSRQSVELDTRNPVLLGGSYVGSGVEITTIQRAYDQFITNNLRESTSSHAALDKFTELAAQIDNILADPEGGLTPLLQGFFSAVQDVSDDPSSGSAREQLLSIAESLVNRFSVFDTRLESLRKNTESDIDTLVGEINQLSQSIADLNVKLEEINASGSLSQQSSDLLDQRDALLQELSEKVGIQVINEPNNLITVQIGNGQTVVAGGTAFTLGTQPAPGDPSRSLIVYNSFTSTADISGNLNGGELGGLLDYRDQILDPAFNSLGRIAIGLADSFNQQHREGMDLLNNLGTDFFSFNQPRSIANTNNTGSATVATTITDVSQLTTDDYQLQYNGAVWTVTSDSGTSTTLAAANGTISFEGLTINIGGAPNPGDSYTIKPTAEGARTIAVAITDANQIAAATAIRAQSSLSNLGDIDISQGVVTDSTNANLLDTVTITFNGAPNAGTFNVVDTTTATTLATNVAYTNGMTVSFNGWEVELSGLNPQAGDQFTVEANLGGSGDNRNMLLLSRLQTTGILDNGVNNYQEAYSVLVGRVGSATATAEIDRDAQLSLKTQAEDRLAQLAGVNLDEEAADLIKYQQAYEAAARVISTAQTLFETLIEVTR
jgi:flagellar hook-associated protein 1 FlgK